MYWRLESSEGGGGGAPTVGDDAFAARANGFSGASLGILRTGEPLQMLRAHSKIWPAWPWRVE
eukprot:11225867-Lingulodinium_polyedra.AAC.1